MGSYSDIIQLFKRGDGIFGVTENGTEIQDDDALSAVNPPYYTFNCFYNVYTPIEYFVQFLHYSRTLFQTCTRISTMPPTVQEGEVVWARMTGYPWWPAVVSPASAPPHLGMWKVGAGRRVSRYHCTFLAWNKETAWMEGSRVRRFKRVDGGEGRRKEYLVMQGDLKQSHTQAVEPGLLILDNPDNPSKYLVKEVEEKSILEDVEGKIYCLLNTVVKKVTDLEKNDVNPDKSNSNRNVANQFK